jgi:hypothetical protein
LPDSRSDAADGERLHEYQRRLERNSPPVSDDEAPESALRSSKTLVAQVFLERR